MNCKLSGEGQRKIISIRVTPDFEELSKDEKINCNKKISIFMRNENIDGDVLLYWINGQQPSIFVDPRVCNAGSIPGELAAWLASMRSVCIECDDEEILRYIWFSRNTR